MPLLCSSEVYTSVTDSFAVCWCIGLVTDAAAVHVVLLCTSNVHHYSHFTAHRKFEQSLFLPFQDLALVSVHYIHVHSVSSSYAHATQAY
jgi:hypothetical protein